MTIAIKIKTPVNIPEIYYSQFNSVKRFAYNRFHGGLTETEVTKVIKLKMNNMGLMDASLIEFAVKKASFQKETPSVIFGSRFQFKRLKHKKGNKEQELKLWDEKRNSSIYLVGRKCDMNGNRKAQLDLLNSQIIVKWNRETHFVIPLPNLSKKYQQQLLLLQQKCERNETHFTLEIKRDSVSVIFDEQILKTETHNFQKNRILSMDLNPNFIGVVIHDHETGQILYKNLYDLKDLNTKDANDNKRKHELYQINTHLISLAKHYQVEWMVFEDLNIRSKNHNKGTRFNKQVNNQWPRALFVQNLKKFCHINDIKFKEIYCAYSSFTGQFESPQDFDPMAAAIEINRRCFEKLTTNRHEIFPRFNIGKLTTRWKEMSTLIPNNLDKWKDIYDWIKKTKLSYRNSFTRDKFSGVSYSLFSRQSDVLCHSLL